MIALRDYQAVLIDGARANIRRGVRRQLLVAPTGAGKTVLAAFMQGGAAARGVRSWFVVHRKEILDRTAETFRDVGIDHGFIAAGELANPGPLVQLCGVQTVANRLSVIDPPEMIVWDECHHVAAATHAAIMAAFPKAIHVGLTATPERLDGKGLRDFFDVMVTGPTTAELIQRGFLAPYSYYAPGNPDLLGVRTTAGDYNRGDLVDLMDKPKLIGNAIEHYQRLAGGKRAIVFEVSRESSRHTVEAFNADGIPALHVDGTMHRDERREAFARFAAGDVLILSNVDLAGEGVDIPAIEAAILRRPTKSVSLFLQQCGRALRLFRGKSEAVILDHAGNALSGLGLPDDAREWSLGGRQKGKARQAANDATPIHQCGGCFRVTPSTVRVCPGCGEPFEVQSRTPEQVDGELVKLERVEAKKRAAEQRKAEERECKTLGDFIRLGTARGYEQPDGWARHQIGIRQGYAQRFRRRA